MSAQKDYGYRVTQTRKHQEKLLGERRFTKKDAYYISLAILTSISLIHSFTKDIRYIVVPVKPVNAEELLTPLLPTVTLTPVPMKTEKTDLRVAKVEKFFQAYNSPLSQFAQDFVTVADRYGLDYTLMPAIAHKESARGTQLPANSYNPFGLGGTHFMYFSSWIDAIEYEGKLLSSDYRSNANYAIGYKYCPPSECAPNWADEVTGAQEEIIND